jgi:hypothetical protein
MNSLPAKNLQYLVTICFVLSCITPNSSYRDEYCHYLVKTPKGKYKMRHKQNAGWQHLSLYKTVCPVLGRRVVIGYFEGSVEHLFIAIITKVKRNTMERFRP